ncbi:hypothetical protein NP233_g6156 [Leucocoprinus birnbaumii]|uniref:Uncharacterized protein n=1 Tax=Leucocoprinus birnbaumii TaxID=56174 RepID=A0AAD5VV18_9AGAR|nr:hypothetical protein NP233_g6156 [Leucocoprinus birnbaumii]
MQTVYCGCESALIDELDNARRGMLNGHRKTAMGCAISGLLCHSLTTIVRHSSNHVPQCFHRAEPATHLPYLRVFRLLRAFRPSDITIPFYCEPLTDPGFRPALMMYAENDWGHVPLCPPIPTRPPCHRVLRHHDANGVQYSPVLFPSSTRIISLIGLEQVFRGTWDMGREVGDFDQLGWRPEFLQRAFLRDHSHVHVLTSRINFSQFHLQHGEYHSTHLNALLCSSVADLPSYHDRRTWGDHTTIISRSTHYGANSRLWIALNHITKFRLGTREFGLLEQVKMAPTKKINPTPQPTIQCASYTPFFNTSNTLPPPIIKLCNARPVKHEPSAESDGAE